MRIDILTLFPEMFSALDHSIIKRARDKGLLDIRLVNFRDYATDRHKTVDDAPYGGGAGMVLMAQPIVDCVESLDPDHRATRIFLSPSGPVMNTDKVLGLAKVDHIILLCGHYEGVDQRAIDIAFDECISIGNYILTGGEIPAMVLVDAVARHVPGVINADSLLHEGPVAYTRPREYRGMAVPKVLLDGNHAEIQRWRKGGK